MSKEIKEGDMYCAVEGCGEVDESHSSYCIKHGRSTHQIKGEEIEICHVCKREKKPYKVFLKNEILSIIHSEQAREDGPICERCDSYFAMAGVLKDATEEEFEIARRAAWFTRMMTAWWEKDEKISEENNKREWGGTVDIAKWCREELSKNKNLLNKFNAQNGSPGRLPGALPLSEVGPSSAKSKCNVCGIYEEVHGSMSHEFEKEVGHEK